MTHSLRHILSLVAALAFMSAFASSPAAAQPGNELELRGVQTLISGAAGEGLQLNFFLDPERDTECSLTGFLDIKIAGVDMASQQFAVSISNPFASFNHVFDPGRDQLRQTIFA
jgi:hypothetical protein